MKHYKISNESYKKIKSFHITEVSDLEILKNNKEHIEKLIKLFNTEYKWDDMFTIDDVFSRIKNNHVLFLLFYGDESIGYVFFRIIDESTCFGYNLYVTKIIDRPKWSASWFYNQVSGIMLERFNKIEVQIEDWNKVVLDIVERIGYKLF